jgi:ubiquinone/menaquinone biosynthesis C-methylase UbiE
MALADLFANNVLVRLVTGDKARYALAVSLIGVRTGERVLLVGSGDGVLLARLAAKAGLSGHVCGIDDRTGSAARAEARAAEVGVLVDIREQGYLPLPFDDAAFDVVAIRPEGSLADDSTLAMVLREAHRVIRPGGRATVALDSRPKGIRGAIDALAPGRDVPPARVTDDLQRFRTAGFLGARLLASRDGWTFVEGARAAGSS